jgi:hypothetical protein
MGKSTYIWWRFRIKGERFLMKRYLSFILLFVICPLFSEDLITIKDFGIYDLKMNLVISLGENDKLNSEIIDNAVTSYNANWDLESVDGEELSYEIYKSKHKVRGIWVVGGMFYTNRGITINDHESDLLEKYPDPTYTNDLDPEKYRGLAKSISYWYYFDQEEWVLNFLFDEAKRIKKIVLTIIGN